MNPRQASTDNAVDHDTLDAVARGIIPDEELWAQAVAVCGTEVASGYDEPVIVLSQPSDVLDLVRAVAPAFRANHVGTAAAATIPPDIDKILAAAQAVVNEALEDAEGQVHVCDVHDDDVKVLHTPQPIQALYFALKAHARAGLATHDEPAPVTGIDPLPDAETTRR